ncbi:hypothetical protein CDZ97_09875 [Mameliella alba]|uniref:vWA domain-containing protein n=1 Tax=Mameliella alba TaxID=561184 RepID=UPI000B52A608|nr:vWA domain-containing protein [Mameliella alba]OWV65152.1 hypothetical protein CDZ97_09875 [Mameliella alba]
MSSALDILWLRPLWLFAVPAALIAGAVIAWRSHGLGRWQTVTDPALLSAMRRLGHVTETRRDPAPWCLALSAALVAAGLAGPATPDPDVPRLRNLDAVTILLDLSQSVTRGGGFDDAQAAVSRLTDTQGTRPIALGVYSGESFLVSVPTEDAAALKTVVAVADAQTMPVAGSRPDRALAMARQVLTDAGAAHPDVVLVSDGGGTGPEARDLARQMAADGMRVSAVFVAPVASPYGMPPARRDGLEALTVAGAGITVDATDTRRLEALLARRQGTAATDRALRNLHYADQGRWFVLLALFPLAPLFRRRRRT